MSLPVMIRGVSYKVAGSYAFKGSLIFAEEVIYFVPYKQLGKTKPPDIEGAGVSAMLGQAGVLGSAIGGAAKSLDDSIRLFDRPVLNLDEVWRNNPSDEELKRILDAHIAELKKSPTFSSDDLPAPSRYSKATVSNLAVSSMGRLSFDTEYEDHVFKIGIIGKGQLRQALMESGFMS